MLGEPLKREKKNAPCEHHFQTDAEGEVAAAQLVRRGQLVEEAEVGGKEEARWRQACRQQC